MNDKNKVKHRDVYLTDTQWEVLRKIAVIRQGTYGVGYTRSSALRDMIDRSSTVKKMIKNL